SDAMPTEILITIIVVFFVAIFLVAAASVAIAFTILDRRQPAVEPSAGAGIFKTVNLSSISVWGDVLQRFDFADLVRRQIAQSGLDWTVGRLTAMMLLAATVSLVILSGIAWVPFWLALVLGGFAASFPYLYMLRRRAQRFFRIEEQLPEALEFLARALRAGHPLAVTIELLGSEHEPPLAAEMRITSDERKLGLSWEDALRHLTERVPLLNIRLLAAAIVLQNRTGGKLSEVLDRLSETMREATMIQGEVRAIAAHGKMTGSVLTILPIGIVVMMSMVSPGYLTTLTDHANGKYLIAGAIGALLLAHFIIRKIVDIKL
ncbi:MAG: type II secretion system F family protein, partial [Bryobacteraceae bacterium]